MARHKQDCAGGATVYRVSPVDRTARVVAVLALAVGTAGVILGFGATVMAWVWWSG